MAMSLISAGIALLIIVKKSHRPVCTSHRRWDLIQLSFRRVGIMAVGVFSSDLAILSMNQEFRVLISGDTSSNVNGFFLGCCSDSCPRITGTLDLPATFGVRSNMLILPHINTPPHSRGRLSRLSYPKLFGSDLTYFSL